MIGIERTSQEGIFTKKTLSDDYERSDYVKNMVKLMWLLVVFVH